MSSAVWSSFYVKVWAAGYRCVAHLGDPDRWKSSFQGHAPFAWDWLIWMVCFRTGRNTFASQFTVCPSLYRFTACSLKPTRGFTTLNMIWHDMTMILMCFCFGFVSYLRGEIVIVRKVTGVSLNDFMYQGRAGQRAQVILLDSQQPTEEALTGIWAVLFHQLLAF